MSNVPAVQNSPQNYDSPVDFAAANADRSVRAAMDRMSASGLPSPADADLQSGPLSAMARINGVPGFPPLADADSQSGPISAMDRINGAPGFPPPADADSQSGPISAMDRINSAPDLEQALRNMPSITDQSDGSPAPGGESAQLDGQPGMKPGNTAAGEVEQPGAMPQPGEPGAAPQAGEPATASQAGAAPQPGEPAATSQAGAAPQAGEPATASQAGAAPQAGEPATASQAGAAPQPGEPAATSQPGAAPKPGEPGAAPRPGEPGAAPRPGEPGSGSDAATPGMGAPTATGDQSEMGATDGTPGSAGSIAGMGDTEQSADTGMNTTGSGERPAEVPEQMWNNITQAAEETGQDPYTIAAMVKQESRFGAALDGSSVSNGDGLIQVEPDTRANYLGKFEETFGSTYSNSELDQLRMGSLILKDRDGDLKRYNGGENWFPGAVDSYGRVIDPTHYVQAVEAHRQQLMAG